MHWQPIDPEVVAELRKIAGANGGLLVPKKVVEAARSIENPLHSRFEWDDAKAASEHRLAQARRLIAFTVEYLPANNREPSRIFVSLTPDRKAVGGGYRETVAVLRNLTNRQQLLQDAFEEMSRFQQKYASLLELADVFSAMSKAVRKRSAVKPARRDARPAKHA